MQNQCLKIGVLRGSFNPPTTAHLNLSKYCIEHGFCDKIIWVPVNDAYDKPTNLNSNFRVDMIKGVIDYVSDISSTIVRKQIGENNFSKYVKPQVLNYIIENKLYQ